MSKKLCTYPDTHSWKNVRALWTISVTFFKFANFFSVDVQTKLFALFSAVLKHFAVKIDIISRQIAEK